MNHYLRPRCGATRPECQTIAALLLVLAITSASGCSKKPAAPAARPGLSQRAVEPPGVAPAVSSGTGAAADDMPVTDRPQVPARSATAPAPADGAAAAQPDPPLGAREIYASSRQEPGDAELSERLVGAWRGEYLDPGVYYVHIYRADHRFQRLSWSEGSSEAFRGARGTWKIEAGRLALTPDESLDGEGNWNKHAPRAEEAYPVRISSDRQSVSFAGSDKRRVPLGELPEPFREFAPDLAE